MRGHVVHDNAILAHAAIAAPFIGQETLLHIRTRKLIGTVALLLFLTAYAFVAMLVAVALQMNASKWVEPVYYVIAGLAWVVPAGGIIWWMQKPD